MFRTLKDLAGKTSALSNHTSAREMQIEPTPAPIERKLFAYSIGSHRVNLKAAPPDREWITNLPRAFARRCLPIVIANQAGWFVLNDAAFEVVWVGGPEPSDLRIKYDDAQVKGWATTHFGFGILTFKIPFLFRTPAGYNLHVRGPSNMPKDGAQALEGIVEADWAVATFTMNWQITRANVPLRFKANEPICMISPVRRGEIEQFLPEIRPLESDAELKYQHNQWDEKRKLFLRNENDGNTWQMHYFRGTSPGGQSSEEHQTKLGVREFIANPSLQVKMEKDSDISLAVPTPFANMVASNLAEVEPTRSNHKKPYTISNNWFHLAHELRSSLDLHFANKLPRPYTLPTFDSPKQLSPHPDQIWSFCMQEPHSYYLRTHAECFFSKHLVTEFKTRLETWAAEHIGRIASILEPEVTIYSGGCFRRPSPLNIDDPGYHYELSLTHWDKRKFRGGETVIIRRSGSSKFLRLEAGLPVYDLLEPFFNQLLVVDSQIPCGVRKVRRAPKPQEGRIVIEGYMFTVRTRL